MYHIGIIALQGHTSTAALYKQGKLLKAVSEERFSRIKEDDSVPLSAIKFLLKSENISIRDISVINFAWRPWVSFKSQVLRAISSPMYAFQKRDNGNKSRFEKFLYMMSLKKTMVNYFEYCPPVNYLDHHKCHAASSIFHNKYKDGYSLVIDGAGENDTISFYSVTDKKLKLLEAVSYPNSMGIFYSGVTKYIGFKPDSGEYKVMGLASYGKPIYKEAIKKLFIFDKKNLVKINKKYFCHEKSANNIFSEKIKEILPTGSLTIEQKQDIAKSAQCVLEEVIEEMIGKLIKKYEIQDRSNWYFSGGVFQNCVLNQHLRENINTMNLFFSPLSSDLGTALGASIIYGLSKNWDITEIENLYLGPEYSNEDVENALINLNLKYEANINLSEIVEEMAAGKILGLYQNASELGPRALGNRSIIADPRYLKMKDKINKIIKKRESFRPFAPVIMEEEFSSYFEGDRNNYRFMIETTNAKENIKEKIQAVVHVDNTARVQVVSEKSNELLYRLIKSFFTKTNIPVLVNTSFNSYDEPIVNSPEDAIKRFLENDIDLLIINKYLVRKEN